MDAELQSQPSTTATTCSLLAQLQNTLISFECNNDIASKQDACVLFTMQLIYGTLHRVPLQQVWPTMRLCIYYHQISSMHETISEHLTDTPEEEQQCAELYNNSDNKWTTHAKTLLGTMEETLSELDAIEFNSKLYTTTIPALLKDENEDQNMRLATRYISVTLIDLMTTDTTEEHSKKLSDVQSKLIEGEAEDDATMVWDILDNEIPHGCSKTVIQQLLTKQVERLRQQLCQTTDNDTESD